MAPFDQKRHSSDDRDAGYVEDIDEELRKPGPLIKDGIVAEHEELSSIEETAASKTAWLISVTVSLGGLLFGYDTGYISSVLETINDSLGHELSSSEQEMVTSLTSGGAFVGAICAGLTADRFGRKLPLWAACVVFVVGTALQTAAFDVAQFAVGRFVVGLGVGSAAMVVPLYSKAGIKSLQDRIR